MAEGSVKQMLKARPVLPLWFAEGKGFKLPNKPGTNQEASKVANTALTRGAAGESVGGAPPSPRKVGSVSRTRPSAPDFQGSIQPATDSFRGNDPSVAQPCTTSILYSTTFLNLYCLAGRRPKASPRAESIPDNLIPVRASVQALALLFPEPKGQARLGSSGVPLPGRARTVTSVLLPRGGERQNTYHT